MIGKIIYLCVASVLFFSLFSEIASAKNPILTAKNKKTSLGKNDFRRGDWTFDGNMSGFVPENARLFATGAILVLSKKGTSGCDFPSREYCGAEIFSKKTYRYGTYSAKIKTAKGKGIVNSFFLYWSPEAISEIDIEILGGNTKEVQYGYYYKDKNGSMKQVKDTVKLGFDSSLDFHEYSITRKQGQLIFLVDGVIKKIYRSNRIPDDFLEIHANIWPSSSVDWAGRFNNSILPVSVSYKDFQYWDNK